jgi:tripartite-type tricarboxylate transporter receptor subunit TctC
MMLMSVRRLGALAALAAAVGLIAPAQAQAPAWPTKPIRMIVSIAAGSLTDVIMRAAANELGPRLGQPLVIDNRGGAAGIPGAQACAQAPNDGHTLCIVFHNQLSFNPIQFTNLPYDADKDLALVTRLFFLIESLAVHPSLNITTVPELKTLAQGKTRALNWGTLGAGSAPELFLRWINNQWGTDIVGIPYRGGFPASSTGAASCSTSPTTRTPTMPSRGRSRGRSRCPPIRSTSPVTSRTCCGCRIRRNTRSTIR